MNVLNPTQEQLSVLKEHYKDIILNWPEGYDFCEVCLIKEGMQQDDLIFCELCNGLVHQSCYGGELLDSIPENDWYCERCREYIKDYMNEQKLHDLSSIRCYFCPEQKGIVKKVTIQHSGAQIWSHVGCVSSIKSLNFVDSTRSLIVQKYSPKKTTNECKICGLKTGNCGYCHTSGCNFTFHFSCGKRIGIIQDVFTMNTLMECREKQYKNSEPEHHVVFCEEHLYNLSYVEYPEDKFLKEFIQNMYIQRETFDAEGDNLSVLLTNEQKCEKIEYNKSQLQEKYQQKKQQLRKSKKTSSTSLSHSKQNIRDKSRSRSRSPPKSDRKIAGGKKPKTSESHLEISEKETAGSKKPAQKSKTTQQQSQTSSKAPAKGKKEEEKQSNTTQAGKSKAGISSSQSLTQNDKASKSKPSTASAASAQSQNQQTQSKNDQISQPAPAQSQTKKQGKKGKNDDEQSNQLIENQDNWRRIQNVMQKYDYREKQLGNNGNNNNSEEQKSNDEAFKTPFYILEELNKTLPKRTTVETPIKSDANEKKDNIEQSEDSKVLQNNYDECSNSEFRDSSSNMMQMIELDSTVLDQDKIIEEQKQSELQTNYQNNSNSNKDKIFVVPIPKTSQAKELKDVNQSDDAEQSSKKLQKKPNKLSDDEKSRVYKKFIMEYVKLNRSKLQGPQSLYIIHPEMMQIMQIQAALPQRKWKKEIAHFFVQKECLNPIQKEVQIKKCINQRIIDLFSDKNIPTNIPSKNFYKLFKANFMIKVYDSVKQLSEFEDILENTQECQENQDNQVKLSNQSQEENKINQVEADQKVQIQEQQTESCNKQQDLPQKDNSNVQENSADCKKLDKQLPEQMEEEEQAQNGAIDQQISNVQQENKDTQHDVQQENKDDQQENKDLQEENKIIQQKNQDVQEIQTAVDNENKNVIEKENLSVEKENIEQENQNVEKENIGQENQSADQENKNVELENKNTQDQNVQQEVQSIQEEEIKNVQQENQITQQEEQNINKDDQSVKQDDKNIQEENQNAQQEKENIQQNNQNIQQENEDILKEKQSEKVILAESIEKVSQQDDLKDTVILNQQQENQNAQQNSTQESESKMQIESEQPVQQAQELAGSDNQKMQIEEGDGKAPQQEQVQEVVLNQQQEVNSNNS
ncbi:hypothetical protein ABPG74_007657 [Tetrahymena malaccensis]